MILSLKNNQYHIMYMYIYLQEMNNIKLFPLLYYITFV